MDKKVLIIGGGAAAALIVGVLLVKRSHANAQESAQQSTPVYADMGFMSSLAPSSGGVSSTSSGGSSGDSGGGGGFDVGTLLTTLITSQGKAQSDSTQTSGGNFDAAILSAISPRNGSASVSHSTNGTTVSVTPSGDLYDQALTDLYQKEFNRAPDAGGMAFWKDAMMNKGVSVVDVQKQMEQSDEYKKTHPA